MTDYRAKYPLLANFLGGYFTVDWKDLYEWQGKVPSFEAVVQLYKSEHSSEVIEQLINELQSFLRLSITDKELEGITSSIFGSGYTPRSRGLTKRQWLEIMVVLLREPTQPPFIQLKNS